MRSGLKLLLITLPLALIGVGFVAYVVSNSPPPERTELAERASAVRVIRVQEQSVTPQVTGFGLVRPARTYEAIAQVAGTAEYVNPMLQKGEILAAGAVLLRLSPADFNLAIAQANANIRAAEARLAELGVAEANLVSSLAIELEALALKAFDLERAEALFAGGTVPQTTRDNARAAHLAQRQKVLGVESSLALQPTQKAVQTEQIAVYQASLETASLNLARTELTLPFAARVASVAVQEGQFVRAGSTAALLDGIEAAEVEAQVSVAEMAALMQASQGQAPALTIDPSMLTAALRGLGLSASVQLRLGQGLLKWPAILDRVSDTIDQKTGTLGVIVGVDSAYSSARPGQRPPLTKGMFVEVVLGAPQITGFLVPRSALRDGRVLLADAEDRLRAAQVDSRIVQGDFALIAAGLTAGDRVVVSAPSPALDGMLLQVSEDTDLMTRLAAVGQAE